MAETNVRIKNEVHTEASKYCSDNGLVLGKYCTNAVKERLEKDKKLVKGHVRVTKSMVENFKS